MLRYLFFIVLSGLVACTSNDSLNNNSAKNKNPDGSFSFEWDPEDDRWKWMNNLTDDQIKTIIEEGIQKQAFLEELANEYDL